jgi:hypothetical protein
MVAQLLLLVSNKIFTFLHAIALQFEGSMDQWAVYFKENVFIDSKKEWMIGISSLF